jgi:hypothetical protein
VFDFILNIFQLEFRVDEKKLREVFRIAGQVIVNNKIKKIIVIRNFKSYLTL